MEENGRVLWTVQWFSRVKGYGFIRPDGDEEDVFIHYSLIRGEGYRNLNRGQRVEFTMEDTPKGPQAVDVLGLETEMELESEGDEVGFEAEPQLSLGEVELESEVDVAGFEAEPEPGLGEVELESGVGVVGLETEPQLGLAEAEL